MSPLKPLHCHRVSLIGTLHHLQGDTGRREGGKKQGMREREEERSREGEKRQGKRERKGRGREGERGRERERGEKGGREERRGINKGET